MRTGTDESVVLVARECYECSWYGSVEAEFFQGKIRWECPNGHEHTEVESTEDYDWNPYDREAERWPSVW